jgi:hypothetical protein
MAAVAIASRVLPSESIPSPTLYARMSLVTEPSHARRVNQQENSRQESDFLSDLLVQSPLADERQKPVLDWPPGAGSRHCFAHGRGYDVAGVLPSAPH